jgi:hypothetical protein
MFGNQTRFNERGLLRMSGNQIKIICFSIDPVNFIVSFGCLEISSATRVDNQLPENVIRFLKMELHQWAVIIVGSLSNMILLAMVAFTYFKRKEYLPFKVKQTNLLLLSVIFGIMWWGGNLVSVNLVTFPATPWTCFLIFYLIPNVLGINAYVSVVAFRMLRLYYIAVRMKSMDFLFFGLLFLQFLPVLLGIIWTLIGWDTVIIADTGYSCYFQSRMFVAYLFGAVVWQVCFLAIINYKCYKVIPSVNEYKESRTILIINLILMTLTMPFIFFGWVFTVWGSVMVNMIHLVASSLFVLVCLAGPIYG